MISIDQHAKRLSFRNARFSETKMIFYEMFDTDCLHCCFDISALTVADNKKRVFFRKLFNSVSDSFINDSGMIF